MNKKDQTTTNQPIILNTLKEKSSYICPNCGEKYCTYVSEKGRKNVIDVGYYFEIGFLEKLIIMNGITALFVDMNGKLENIQRINHKEENYIMDATTKTALLTPDPPDNFQVKILY